MLLKKLVHCTMNPIFFIGGRNMHVNVYLKLGSVNNELAKVSFLITPNKL